MTYQLEAMRPDGPSKGKVHTHLTMIQEECPLMAVMGTLAEGCDITPSLRSGFQMLHEKSKLQQGGGPGGLMVVQACVVEDVLEPEITRKPGQSWQEASRVEQAKRS